jgi:AI-2 transport protein TqsA
MIDSEVSSKSSSGRFLIYTAAFVIIIAGMRAASSLLVPFLLSLFIAVICLSPFLWLQRKGVPKALALVMIIISILGIGLLIGTLVGTSINGFSEKLPAYQKSLQDKTVNIISWVESLGINIPNQKQILDSFDPREPLRWIGVFLSAFTKVLSRTFLILIAVIFMLLEASGFPAKLRAAYDNPESSLGQFSKIHENIKRYLILKTLISFFTGVTVTIWLIVLGVDFPLLWGFLAFLLNYIPSIGSILAAIPAVLLALIQYDIGYMVLTAAGYLVINFIYGNILEPKVMGEGLGLSTLVIFVSLIFWGWVLGPIGMLLSVLLTMVLKIALDSRDDTRWISILLGPEISKSKVH